MAVLVRPAGWHPARASLPPASAPAASEPPQAGLVGRCGAEQPLAGARARYGVLAVSRPHQSREQREENKAVSTCWLNTEFI